MSDLIEQFASEYHDYHGISQARRIDQVRALRLLEAHAGGDLTTLSGQDLSRWFHGLVAEGMAPTTVRKYRGLVAPWLRWARDNRLIEVETYRDMKEVRLPRGAVSSGTPDPYTRSEINQLWRDVARDYPWARNERGRILRTTEKQVERADYYLARWRAGSSSYRRVRAYAQRLQVEAIISLCMCGGLRRDECFNLALDNMDPLNEYVVVIGAAKNPDAEVRPRAVPWTTPYMRTAVERWLLFRAELAPPHDRPWLSLWGTTSALHAMSHRRYEMLLTNLGDGYEFRRLRHTAATEMLRAGYPLHEVQRILGHSRIEQTLAYAELLPDDVVKTALKQQDKLAGALFPHVEVPTGVPA